MDTLSLAIGAIGAFILREFGGWIFRRLEATTGASGYVPDGYGFFLMVQTEDGRTLETIARNPWAMHPGTLSFPLTIKGELFNDTNTNIVLKSPRVLLIHPVKEPHMYSNPVLLVEGESKKTVTIPAHGSLSIRIEMPTTRDTLVTTFAERLPILQFERPNGREIAYRAASVFSLTGRAVVWPRKGKRPIYLPDVEDKPSTG